MCAVDLEEVQQQCGTNTAGNKFLYIANEEDNLAVPDPDATTGAIVADITMKTGKQYFAFGFTEDTCLHDETVNDNDALIGSITCFFGKDDTQKRKRFFEMIGGKFSAIVTDNNDLTKLARNVSWRPNFSSGENPENDKNGYTVTLSYKGTPAKVYTGAVPLTPGA